jgi:D-sedoheptulose 7-phosphate isomerase
MGQAAASSPSASGSASLEARIEAHFADSAKLKQDSAKLLSAPIARAVSLMAASLKSGGKILACGNGGSAADAQHFAAELVNRFERERAPLASIALTTDTSTLTSIANDYGYEQVFGKQLHALGRRGDVLLAISTSGKSPSVLAAVRAARELGMPTVALTGNGGGPLGGLLAAEDVHICVPHARTMRIQEVHLLALHCLCDGIDAQLYGEKK